MPFSRQVMRLTVGLGVFISLFAAGFSTLTTAHFGSLIPAVGPPNDDYANAQPIVGPSGLIIGSNIGATKEPSEPDHAFNSAGASVWYVWQAPADGRYTFTTFGSNFNTVLDVYSGATFPGINVVFNDDDPKQNPLSPCGGGGASRVSFNAVAGITYHIAVDSSKGGATGSIKLRWGRSATISGRITTASGDDLGSNLIRLEGIDACRETESTSIRKQILFTDVPTGGTYNVFFTSVPGLAFQRWGTGKIISPLTGDVFDFNYYLVMPTANISGKVTVSNSDFNSLKVTCESTGTDLVTLDAAFDPGTGEYTCFGLPIAASYVVTPSKQGVNFAPNNRTVQLGGVNNITNVTEVDFSLGYKISGRVTKSIGGTGVGGVSVLVSGSQTASTLTNANGNYSLTVAELGSYTVTPSNTNLTFAPGSLSFNHLVADQTANFAATFILQLVPDDMGQVAALDSMLWTRDPFPVVNVHNNLFSGVDRNTRVVIFIPNFALLPGELPSSVVINLVGSNNQSYNIPAEDVRQTSHPTFTQIIFRLPDGLSPGICTLTLKAHGLTSNVGSMKIAN